MNLKSPTLEFNFLHLNGCSEIKRITMTQKRSTEYDSPWKDIIEHFFEDFMIFFYPQVHSHIDWTQGYEFLDQELQKVLREAVTQNRRVDKLVKVWLQNGQETLLYIHIEIQAQYDPDFSHRMFIYHYRIHDRYGPSVTSLAILGDNVETWRPRNYHYETIGSELSFCFSMVKLLDYKEKWDELEKSSNPFAMVVRVHLKGLETQKSPEQRLDWKKTLYQALYEENYSEKETMGLLIFLDWLLTLPNELSQRFDEFVYDYEEAKRMQYVTTFERKGIEKGIQEGFQQALQLGKMNLLQKSREYVIEILILRFHQLPEKLMQKIQSIDDPLLLSELHREAVLVNSLEDFEERIETSSTINDVHNTLH